MRVNPRNVDSIKEFFRLYEGLTTSQLAILADTATCTIDEWKRKCGLIKSGYKKPEKKSKGPIPNNWDNKEWFEQAYDKMGIRAIALLIGKGKNWGFVTGKLDEYGISRKSHKERVMSHNPCCDEDWLHYYYSDRANYLTYCKRERVKPCPDGGQRMTLTECAGLAGVVAQTIVNWLTNHKMKVRNISESMLGEYNSNHKAEYSPGRRRKTRDEFFEKYRTGIINIPLGTERFSNGIQVDKEEITAKRFNTKIRGTSKRPSS